MFYHHWLRIRLILPQSVLMLSDTHLIQFVLQLVVSGQQTEGLQRLAQTHVITQDAMQLVLVQEAEPVDTILCRYSHISNTDVITHTRTMKQVLVPKPCPSHSHQ